MLLYLDDILLAFLTIEVPHIIDSDKLLFGIMFAKLTYISLYFSCLKRQTLFIYISVLTSQCARDNII